MIESTLLAVLLQSVGQNTLPLPTDSNVLLAQEIPAVQEEGFVFEFLDCEVTPNSDVPLTCEFLIENSRTDERRLSLYARSNTLPSRVIDASGNEIIASFVTLGSAGDSRTVRRALPSEVPMKGTLSFNKAPEGAIRILDLGLYTPGPGYFDVEFRFAR